jgi:serine/threonine-protein kinase RsbT
LRRARQRSGIHRPELSQTDLAQLGRAMEAALRLFLPNEQDRAELLHLIGGIQEVKAASRDITTEQDVRAARTIAGELAEALGANSFVANRIVTAASELARNIIHYAGAGRIDITPFRDPPRLRVYATDSGPGIPPETVKAVMAGTYRSRTGLGKGIAGVKKLADKFNIETGPEGTVIEAIFFL